MNTFDELDANAPKIPPYTCPTIDSAITVIKEAVRELDGLTGRWGDLNDARTEDNGAVIDRCISTVRDAAYSLNDLHDRNWHGWAGEKGQLEKIRNANSELREAADYWRDEAKKLADENDALTERIAELESELEEERGCALKEAA